LLKKSVVSGKRFFPKYRPALSLTDVHACSKIWFPLLAHVPQWNRPKKYRLQGYLSNTFRQLDQAPSVLSRICVAHWNFGAGRGLMPRLHSSRRCAQLRRQRLCQESKTTPILVLSPRSTSTVLVGCGG
jgi:hypothetical protein